ncbi:hypothetical protein EIP91_003277 [Steccherinum ochraceum]|uniref:Uncharacterized protein n=1 Tax=Steccherinum ochraceum TaxID=92696 RepID=A0A4R0RH62_9APHY|nr:hypothetical protein EIP91_003277 [Steccherinum ochraceum]
MMLKTTFTILALAVAGASAQICPGFNYGIADLGGQVYRIYDDSCNTIQVVDDSSVNPCTAGQFSCSPPPITITGAEIRGLWYNCRGDPRSGSCNGENINVCCRNDGH